jgi:NADPH-dependent 2,4-dienoyl-CoA reductase/sulfur reductase-like enzyme
MPRSVVIVGAGPAGMAAAIEAVARGCRVTLIDEAALPGGQIYRQSDPALKGQEFSEPTEQRRKHRLLEDFQRASSGIDYRPNTTVFALFPGGEIHIAQGDATEVLRPDAVILATGVREKAIPFPGWTTPGVMFAGGAQAILKSQRELPGRQAVVAGCGPLPMVVAAQLLRAGGDVRALAMLNPLGKVVGHLGDLLQGADIVYEGLRYAATILRNRVPRLAGHLPIRAIGRERLEAVVLARLQSDGRVVPGSEREIACDLLALNYGFLANSELVALAGAKMRHDPVCGWIPEIDTLGRTSVPGVYAAGDGAGLRGALIAEIEGRIVGAAAASTNVTVSGAEIDTALRRRRRYQNFQRAVRAMLQVPESAWRLVTDETIVCRCENVRLGEIRGAFAEGHLTLNAVKRNVRSGMGWCAGRMCLHSVAALTALHTGKTSREMMTPRPMIRPVSFAALANQKKASAP